MYKEMYKENVQIFYHAIEVLEWKEVDGGFPLPVPPSVAISLFSILTGQTEPSV